MSINGCRWQDKSFSVDTIEKPKDACRKCGTPITGTIYKYNGDTLCAFHFSQVKIKQVSGIGLFHTHKDKLYEFTDVNTTGKPIQFSSKGQWQRHLKRLGLHDDVKQHRSAEEIKNSFEKRNKFHPVPREELKKAILESYNKIRRR